MKTQKIPLPKFDKLEFGNEEQINSIREYQRKIEELENTYKYKVRVEIDTFESDGSCDVEVETANEEAVEDLAFDEARDYLLSCVALEATILDKEKLIQEEEIKEHINPNNLSLFEVI